MGLAGAKQGELAQALGPEPRQVDGAGEGHQGLVGAHVGLRLLTADVLLARLEREHVAATAVSVEGLAHDPARDLADMGQGGGEQPEVGAAEVQGAAEQLPLPHHHIGAIVTRPSHQPGRERVEHDHQECAEGVRSRGLGSDVDQTAEVVGLTDDERGRSSVGRPPVTLDHPMPGGPRAREQHLAKARVHGARHPHVVASRRRHREVDALDQGRSAVVEAGVGHLHPGERAQYRLVFEQALEDALRHLGLVRRVRRGELGPYEGAHGRRQVVVVRAGAGEAHEIVAVLRRVPIQ